MKVLYLLSMVGNPLYRGKFPLHGRYQTYGQASFIYDFLVAASRRGMHLELAVEGLPLFPLAAPLAQHCKVVELGELAHLGRPDLILLDVVTDSVLGRLPRNIPAFCIVHDAYASYSDAVVSRCERFVCMTETALRHQGASIDPSRLVLIHQGVDTQRFMPPPSPERRAAESRILIYSRLNRRKMNTLVDVVERLLHEDAHVTFLADGNGFWEISDRFGAHATIVNYVPCHSMHHFLPGFDLVVSSGRGVMEALASGVPALCAGVRYGGPVLPDNIARHLKSNLTGYGMRNDPADLAEHLQAAMSLEPETCRRLAEEHCSVDRFIDRLVDTYEAL